MLALILAAALGQTPAPAPSTPRPSVITMPDWQSRPTGADLARLYPKGALAKNLEGQAVLRCRVDASGALTDCSVTDETPTGEGFGEAALAMSPLFHMRPMTRDGVPVAGGRINIPIRFGLPKAAPLTLETALECYGVISAHNLKLANGDLAETGWRDAVEVLAAREHFRPADVDAQLNAAREFATSPAGEERAQAQVNRCRAIRNSGALAALNPH